MGLRYSEEEYQDLQRRLGALEQIEEERSFEQFLSDLRDDMIAKRIEAREDEPGPKFRSKTERRAWNEWVPTTGCVAQYYEPIRVYLNSGSYQPDFVLRMPDRELWFIEVKGAWNAYKSGRSSKKSLKEAAKMYWWLGRWFSLLPKKGGGWNLEEIT